MNAVESIQQQPDCNLEPPSPELVEALRSVMNVVAVPAGLRSVSLEEGYAIKEFACQLPVSRGFNSGTLQLLYRLVSNHQASDQPTVTVDWPTLQGVWSGICERGNRPGLVEGLPLLLQWCFETNNIRVIGLCELEWHPADRKITIRTHRPNFIRMTEYLQTALNLELGNSAHNPASHVV